MLLDLHQTAIPMKMVYTLQKELEKNPERILRTQKATLDETRPLLGLKGTNGLFGSQEWWDNINTGKALLRFCSGVITRMYIAGMDAQKINCCTLLLDNGETLDESIYANNRKDRKLFQVGHRVALVYVLDELKDQPAFDGSINYCETVLELAISLNPVLQA